MMLDALRSADVPIVKRPWCWRCPYGVKDFYEVAAVAKAAICEVSAPTSQLLSLVPSRAVHTHCDYDHMYVVLFKSTTLES